MKPELRNYRELPFEPEEKKRRIETLDSNEIIAAFPALQNFKRCGGSLIFQRGEIIEVICRPEDFSGFLKTRFGVDWETGKDAFRHELTTKNELFFHLLRISPQYALITKCPHVPLLSDVYYFPWQPAPNANPALFEQVLTKIFNNVKSELDAVLLRALFMAPMFGSTDVPAFFLTGPEQNIGKTKIIDAVADLYGPGYFNYEMGGGYSKLATELMTPTLESLSKRIIRVDNITATHDRGLAQLITEPVISGHQMWLGDASRRNYFVVLGSINRESFSFHRDISTRSFFIELVKPEAKSKDWECNYALFFGHNPALQPDPQKVQQRRHALLSSIYARYQQQPAFNIDGIDANHVRHQTFLAEVLPRCCHSRAQFEELLAYIKQRIATSDYDIEAMDILMANLAHLAKSYASNGHRCSVGIGGKTERVWLTAEEVAKQYNQIVKKDYDQMTVTLRIRTFCEHHKRTELKYMGKAPGGREDLGTKRGFWFNLVEWETKENGKSQCDAGSGTTSAALPAPTENRGQPKASKGNPADALPKNDDEDIDETLLAELEQNDEPETEAVVSQQPENPE